MESYPRAAVERAMKVQEVIMRAMAKKITWAQAGEIIGLCERQMRRWKERYEEFGNDGLFDRRTGKPSPKRVPGHAFLPVRGKNLELVFSLHHERTVNQDNTVHLGSRILQIEKTRWRATLAGCRVTVYEHLDGSCSIGYGPHLVGHYNQQGIARLLEKQPQPKTLGRRGERSDPRFPRLNTINQPLTPKPNRTFHVL